MRKMKCLLITLWIFTYCLLPKANATVIEGPFLPNTGYWDIIQYGDAEKGDTTGWELNVSSYTKEFSVTSKFKYEGKYSFKLVSENMNTGWGIAAKHTEAITLEPGSYVLSGFILAPDVSAKHNYLDLNDWSGEPKDLLVIGGDSQNWQFVYGEFQVPDTGSLSLYPRIVRDSYLQDGSVAYFDEIAITPKDKFRPPVPVPEPSSGMLLLLACGFGILWWGRHKKTNQQLHLPF